MESYEIELKAHIDDRKSVIEKLKSFAKFDAHVQKKDVYWSNGQIKARIREESKLDEDNKEIERKTYLTYKRKELRKDETSLSYEVNEEYESEISDSKVLEEFFKDLKMEIYIKKSKDVISFFYETEGENLHIELCNVPPLGDFLEIEITVMYEKSENKEKIDEYAEFCRNLLLDVLKKCDISESKIERRYYSEMLEEVKNSKHS